MSSRKKSGLGRQAGALFPQTPPVDDLFSPTVAPAAPANVAAPVQSRQAGQTGHNGQSAAKAPARTAPAVMPEPTLPLEAEVPAQNAAPQPAQQVAPQAQTMQTAQMPASEPRRPGRPPAPVGPEGPKKIKSTSLRVEEGLYKRFRQICLAKDVTVQVAIEEAIRNYIEEAERG
ncbi:hypothetical protein LJC48_07535 [Desulfovibrio sp. OttesenSCG-928-C06]|nr:hypothetical protein [Desulfovibrio sp. OttesenSCG-928-C06]